MAGDWIKVEKATPRKLEILAIAARLGIHADHAFGLCFRFWSWCDDNFAETNAPSVSKSLVSALVERSDFVDALVSVGWFIDNGDTVSISNFDRHLSQTAKQRALTSRRVAKHDLKKANGKLTLGALAREEKRREEIKGNPLKSPLDQEEESEKNPIVKFDAESLPAELRSTPFCEAWKDWIDYRHQTRKPVRLAGQNKAFKRALEIGADVAAEKLLVAMANGYQGWDFGNDGRGGGKPSGRTSSATASQRFTD